MKPQSGADAAGEGHDVFQGRRQFYADDVIAGVDPEIVVHKGVLDKSGHSPVRAGGDAACGKFASHLLRVGGTGEGGHLADISGGLLENLAHAETGLPLNALGDGHENGLRPQVWTDFFPCGPNSEGGSGADHHVRAGEAIEISGDVEGLRQKDAFQQGVLPGFCHLGRLLRGVGPEGYVVPVVVQNQCQSRAPAAGT